VVLCAGIGVTVAGATRSSSKETRSTPTTVDDTPAARAAVIAAAHFVPANGAVDVPLDAVVGVLIDSRAGYVRDVKVTDNVGGVLAGVRESVRAWHSTGTLQPGRTYTMLTTFGAGANVIAHATTTFTTMNPTAHVTATLWPDGLEVGVAQPVVVKFSQPITDPKVQAAVLSHFTVTTKPHVTGGWKWFSDKELHFRPKNFWPSGTSVDVVSNLEGWNAGNGMWGTGSVHIHFTVGAARISTANLATHYMQVTENGVVVANYPMSAGRPKYPTMNGTHIVLDRESVVHMISSTNGIPVNSPDGYDELVYNNVHISDSGEYVHAAPWSVSDQGVTNVSHGCINLAPANALVFMNFSRIGDVVNVVGGPRPPDLGDHGVMDWDTPWSQFTPVADPAPAPPPHSSAPPARAIY
jgi:lipoprotein-anchoring transpeptidase ErfK/SrfK